MQGHTQQNNFELHSMPSRKRNLPLMRSDKTIIKNKEMLFFWGFTDDLILKSPAFYRMSFSAFQSDAIYFLIAGARVTTWPVA